MVTMANGRGKESRFQKNLQGDITLAVRRDLIEHSIQFPQDTQQDIAESIGEKYGAFNAMVNGHTPWKIEPLVALARGQFYGGIRAVTTSAGGMFVLSPRISRSCGLAALSKSLLKMMKEVHEAIQTCFQAIADRVLFESERDKCVAEIDQAIAALHVARQRLLEAPVQKEIAHV